MNWLDHLVPSRFAYVHNAALICEDCARKILKTPLEDPLADGGGESDSAHFCDSGRSCESAVTITPGHKIGAPLGNPLTREGAEALRQSIIADLVSPQAFNRRVGRLLRRVWSDYASSGDLVERVLPPRLPPSLAKLVRQHTMGPPRSALALAPRMVCDVDDVYLLARSPTEHVVLLRCPTSDEGEWDEVNAAHLGYVPDGSTGEILRNAVADMIWD